MLTRRNLFTALAGLCAAPGAPMAKEPSTVEQFKDIMRAQFPQEQQRWIGMDFGVDGKVTMVELKRSMFREGTILRLDDGTTTTLGPRGQASLRARQLS